MVTDDDDRFMTKILPVFIASGSLPGKAGSLCPEERRRREEESEDVKCENATEWLNSVFIFRFRTSGRERRPPRAEAEADADTIGRGSRERQRYKWTIVVKHSISRRRVREKPFLIEQMSFLRLPIKQYYPK